LDIVAFAIDVPPLESIPKLPGDQNEIRYFSDGSYDPRWKSGSAAAIGPTGGKGCKLELSSSYFSELHGLERLTSLAVEDNHEHQLIIFISDNARILSSIKQWHFRHMRQAEFRICENLQRMLAKGNKDKFTHVVSHTILIMLLRMTQEDAQTPLATSRLTITALPLPRTSSILLTSSILSLP
jgi:hypothetical protein